MLLIFDWDGTLSNSLGKIVSAMSQAAESCGLKPLPDEAVRAIIGLALPEAVQKLYPQVTQGIQSQVQEAYKYFYRSNYAEPGLYDGVESILRILRQQGHSLAVATGKGRAGLDHVLEASAIGHFFHATRCADETESKPSPSMVFELMNQLDHRPDDTCFIGDTTYDLAMAQAAGVGAVGVTYGAHPPEQLKSVRPCELINHISELLNTRYLQREV
jgi:phosphoglycolate phosphatase